MTCLDAKTIIMIKYYTHFMLLANFVYNQLQWRPGIVGVLWQSPIYYGHRWCAATTITGLSILWCCPQTMYAVFLFDDCSWHLGGPKWPVTKQIHSFCRFVFVYIMLKSNNKNLNTIFDANIFDRIALPQIFIFVAVTHQRKDDVMYNGLCEEKKKYL